MVCLRDNHLTEDQILFHYKTIYYVQGNEIIELKGKELEYEIKHNYLLSEDDRCFTTKKDAEKYIKEVKI